jgi:hypothetical protein
MCFMNLRAKYLVAVVVLAASVVGAFAPAGACLRSVFDDHGTPRQVLAVPDSGKTHGPLQLPACFTDARNLIASAIEAPVWIHRSALVSADVQARGEVVSHAGTAPVLADSSPSVTLFLAPPVLRI